MTSPPLDEAARRWPGLSRSQLLVRLALEGYRSAQRAHEERHRRRLAALRKHSGALSGAYGPDYLQQMCEEWPAADARGMASVLIAYLEGEDVHHEAGEALLAREIDDDFGANPLTLAEVFVVPARDDRLDEVRLTLRELEVEALPFPGDTAVKLALLRSETGLKMHDCCVLQQGRLLACRAAVETPPDVPDMPYRPLLVAAATEGRLIDRAPLRRCRWLQ